MTSPSSKFALLAQVIFVAGMLIMTIGFIHLLSSGGISSFQAIERHMPFARAFVIATAASVMLGIVATVLNIRARPK